MSKPRPPSLAERRAVERAADAARQRELYGDAVDDVALLRRRGFVITRDGGKIGVDNKLLTLPELKALARRERGLMGVAAAPLGDGKRTAGSGLVVGDRVALTPKPMKPPPRAVVARLPASPKARAAPPVAPPKAKAERHSLDLGTRPRVVWLGLAQLVVDKTYQREIGGAGTTHVNRLLREFNWNCYQPIIVGEREDGRFAVIDGQHRLEAARKHPAINELPCYVVDAPGVAAQAAVFATVNGRRLALTSQQKFWAAHAGGDAAAVEIERLCAVAGVSILRSPPSYDIPARSILALFTLQKMVRQVGVGAVGSALELLAEAHGETPNAFRSPTIVALSRIAAAKSFSFKPAMRALRALDLDRLYDDARRDRVTGGGHARNGRGACSAPSLRRDGVVTMIPRGRA